MGSPQPPIIPQVFTQSGNQPAATGSCAHAELFVDPVESDRCLSLDHFGKEAFSRVAFTCSLQLLLFDLKMPQPGREQFHRTAFSMIS